LFFFFFFLFFFSFLGKVSPLFSCPQRRHPLSWEFFIGSNRPKLFSFLSRLLHMEGDHCFLEGPFHLMCFLPPPNMIFFLGMRTSFDAPFVFFFGQVFPKAVLLWCPEPSLRGFFFWHVCEALSAVTYSCSDPPLLFYPCVKTLTTQNFSSLWEPLKFHVGAPRLPSYGPLFSRTPESLKTTNNVLFHE